MKGANKKSPAECGGSRSRNEKTRRKKKINKWRYVGMFGARLNVSGSGILAAAARILIKCLT